MSVDEVKGRLREGTETLESAATTIGSVRETVRNCHLAAIAVLQDSRHDHVTAALSLLREAETEGELVQRRVQNSSESAGKYVKAFG